MVEYLFLLSTAASRNMSKQDSQTTFQNQWNAELYDRKHSFVSQLGSDAGLFHSE